MSNSATTAPTRKVSARKATASAAALPTSKTVQAPAPIENEAPAWRTTVYAARAKISELLKEALAQSKEENEDSSSWAHRLISNAIASNETSGDDTPLEIADTACNVEAALQGMLSLADDPVVPVVRNKIEHAIAIIDAICTFNAQEIKAAIEAVPSAPATPIENEARANRVAQSDDLLQQGERRWNSAVYLLRACLDTYTADINYAADSLGEAALRLLAKATDDDDFQAADEASSEMWRAAAIVQYRMCDNACGAEEMFALEGIHSLMTMAMELVTGAVAKAQEGGAA